MTVSTKATSGAVCIRMDSWSDAFGLDVRATSLSAAAGSGRRSVVPPVLLLAAGTVVRLRSSSVPRHSWFVPHLVVNVLKRLAL